MPILKSCCCGSTDLRIGCFILAIIGILAEITSSCLNFFFLAYPAVLANNQPKPKNTDTAVNLLALMIFAPTGVSLLIYFILLYSVCAESRCAATTFILFMSFRCIPLFYILYLDGYKAGLGTTANVGLLIVTFIILIHVFSFIEEIRMANTRKVPVKYKNFYPDPRDLEVMPTASRVSMFN